MRATCRITDITFGLYSDVFDTIQFHQSLIYWSMSAWQVDKQ